MMNPKGESFTASDIIHNNELQTKEIGDYAKIVDVKIKDLTNNWTQLCAYWPVAETPLRHRLKAGHPSTPFFKFVSGSIKTYPDGVLEGLRKGSEALHLAGVLLAAYFAMKVTQPYFEVSEHVVIVSMVHLICYSTEHQQEDV